MDFCKKYYHIFGFLFFSLLVLVVPSVYADTMDDYLTELHAKAESGDMQAQLELAEEYRFGKHGKKDYAEALKWYLKAAQQGNDTAQYALGVLYTSHKLGVERDYTEAAKWYLKAAQGGNSAAQYTLGNLYLSGLGVERNTEEGLKWHRKAAEQGDELALVRLATLYENGQDGVKKDDAEAIKWLMKSAEQHNFFSRMNIAERYEQGRGVPRDITEAYFWACVATDCGRRNSQPPREGDNSVKAEYKRAAQRILATPLTPEQEKEVNKRLHEAHAKQPMLIPESIRSK